MFTRFYALLRAFTRFYALLRAFTRFYALLRAFTRFYALLRAFQGYTVVKFYPLSLRYRDPAASPWNARQYMFENQAIKLINRQLGWLTGSLTCLRACTRFYALLRVFTRFCALLLQLSSLTCLRAFISVKQFTPFTVYSVNNLTGNSGLHSF